MAEQAYQGFVQPESFGSAFNAQVALIKSILSTVRTAALVEVVACTNDGALAAVGTVDVHPIVNQLDGFGNMVPHGVIYSCPYFRLQGGANAIIIDPEPGDIGIAIFSDRDISNVIKTRKQANPGSNRKFDMADACYLGCFLTGEPRQYIQFSSAGVKVYSLVDIIVQAVGNITATAGGNASVQADGNASVSAQGTVSVNGHAGVNIESAANVSISGDGGVSITTAGDATCDVGGDLTATATGAVEISGATISLN